jgi:hypothetical protein
MIQKVFFSKKIISISIALVSLVFTTPTYGINTKTTEHQSEEHKKIWNKLSKIISFDPTTVRTEIPAIVKIFQETLEMIEEIKKKDSYKKQPDNTQNSIAEHLEKILKDKLISSFLQKILMAKNFSSGIVEISLGKDSFLYKLLLADKKQGVLSFFTKSVKTLVDLEKLSIELITICNDTKRNFIRWAKEWQSELQKKKSTAKGTAIAVA